MQAMMKQMGINQEEIDANRVVIERDDGNIIIDNPNVVKIGMQGQENFQITGDVSEEKGEVEEVDNTNDEIKTLMEKCNCLEEEAKLALEKANGDLTEAILDLSE